MGLVGEDTVTLAGAGTVLLLLLTGADGLLLSGEGGEKRRKSTRERKSRQIHKGH